MSPTRSQSRALIGEPSEDEADARPALDLATVYRQHADAVATWTRRLGGPDIDVEDIVHEIFLVVQRRLPEWRGDAKVTTWLYEITLRVVSERRRRWRGPGWWARKLGGERPAAEELARVATEQQPDALGLLERREASAVLYRLLDGIGEKYRTVIILFELEGKSGEEVAALTGTSVANVWIRLHRGRQKLVSRLQAWEAQAKQAEEMRRPRP
jgi:RNA polymerase sigma-70 factor (ECF subfamily)